VERNQTKVMSHELGNVAAMFESDPELRNVFAWPWIPATEKSAVATGAESATWYTEDSLR
jgi:F0F1-type ATP synthase delta subunit